MQALHSEKWRKNLVFPAILTGKSRRIPKLQPYHWQQNSAKSQAFLSTKFFSSRTLLKVAIERSGKEDGPNELESTAHGQVGLYRTNHWFDVWNCLRMLGGSISLLVAARLAIRSEKPGAKQCDQYAGEQAGDKAEPEVMPNIHPKQFAVLGNRIEGGLGQGCTIRARADNFSVYQHHNGF